MNMMNVALNHQNNLQSFTSPNFKGRVSAEIVQIGQKEKLLIHETAFFREYKSMKKSIDYLKQNFPDEKQPLILVGACSSGEQALSIKMLLNDRTPKILGFDISNKSINEANSQTYRIYQPIKNTDLKKIKEWNVAAYGDEFLAFDRPNQNLSPEKKRLRKVFYQTFDEIKQTTPKNNFFKRMYENIISKITGRISHNMNVKTFRIKKTIDSGCEFVQGDILQLNKIVPEGKAHMITFSNALYHLVTEDAGFCGVRRQIPLKSMLEIFEEIAKQTNKTLVKKGLFVLGEREDKQMTNIKLFCEILKENGFREATNPSNRYCNIWQKYKDID